MNFHRRGTEAAEGFVRAIHESPLRETPRLRGETSEGSNG
jgi:hypothetical protein